MFILLATIAEIDVPGGADGASTPTGRRLSIAKNGCKIKNLA
jgi:hypothetical protein